MILFTQVSYDLEEVVTTGQKSDLHPSALTINDLNPGRTIIWFSVYNAELGTYVVCERPVICRNILGDTCLKVKLRNVLGGYPAYVLLTELGVVSYVDGTFNRAAFTVDHRKRRLLPSEVRPRPFQPSLPREEEELGLLHFGDPFERVFGDDFYTDDPWREY